MNLAEVSGGEMAIANLHSCNGPDFVLQLSFLLNVEEGIYIYSPSISELYF